MNVLASKFEFNVVKDPVSRARQINRNRSVNCRERMVNENRTTTGKIAEIDH